MSDVSFERLPAGIPPGSSYPFSEDTLRLIADIQQENPDIETRVEQIEALDAIEAARQAGASTTLIQMAPGLGKTTVMAADARRLLSQSPEDRVLFLCHQNRILEQSRDRFEKIVGPDHTYGIFTGEERDYHEVTCLFASFQAMRRWREAFMPDEFRFGYVDEGHHAKAVTYEPTVRYFAFDSLVGVTATPDRMDQRNIREVFGPERYTKPLEEAIAEGSLTQVDYQVCIDDVETNRLLVDIHGDEHAYTQLNRSIFVPLRDQEMADICIADEADIQGPVKRLVFCTSIEDAEEFAQYFDRAAPVHSGLPTHEVKKYLDQLRSGELDTLLTIDMFNEGIDVPDVNQVVFRRMTESPTIFLQQLGRGLRKFPGKERVQVRDFVANADRLLMVREFWDKVQTHAEKRGIPKEVQRVQIGEVKFSKTTRDVLEVLSEVENTLQTERQMNETGWMTLGGLANSLGVTDDFIGRIAGLLEVETSQISRGRRTYYYLNPEDAEAIVDYIIEHYQDMPEDYVHISTAAENLGVSRAKIERIISDTKMAVSFYPSPLSKKLGMCLSPEQIQDLRKYPDVQADYAPEEFVTRRTVSEQIGFASSRLFADLVAETGVTPTPYLTDRGLLTDHYSPRDIDILREAYERRGSPVPEEGFISVNQAHAKLDVTLAAFQSACEDLGIEITTYRSPRNIPVAYVSDEDYDRIAEHPIVTSERGSDTLVGFRSFARSNGLSTITLESMCVELGIEVTMHRTDKGRLSKHLTPENVASLEQHPLLTTTVAPDGFYSVNDLSEELGRDGRYIDQMVKSLGMEWQRFKNSKGRVSRYLSPEDLEQLKQHPYFSYQPAPDTVVTAFTAAGSTRRAQLFREKAIELGIQPAEYLAGNGQLAEYYTADQAEHVKRNME